MICSNAQSMKVILCVLHFFDENILHYVGKLRINIFDFEVHLISCSIFFRCGYLISVFSEQVHTYSDRSLYWVL